MLETKSAAYCFLLAWWANSKSHEHILVYGFPSHTVMAICALTKQDGSNEDGFRI
jgi:hypothetical protein